MKLGEYSIDIYKEGINGKDKRNEYLLKKLQELDSEAKEAEDTRYFEVNVDGWIFWVNKDNQEIEIQGEEKNPLVRIKEIKLTTSTNSIKVDVEVKRGEGAKYKYYYKKQDTTDAFKLAKETNSTNYTIENLEQNVTYVIKVEATNENGTVSKEAVGRTVEIPDAQGAIEFSSPIWNNGKAEVTITKTTNDSMKIQYKIGTGTYQIIASGEKITNLELGNIVTARLWDGTNGGNTTSLNVQDLINPNEATITLSKQTISVGETITANVSQSDNESGIDITRCKWIYNQTSTKLGEDETKYTGKFTSASETISLTTTNPGDYYLHVLTVDKAGNKTEKVSKKITIKSLVTKITLSPTTLNFKVGDTASQKINASIEPADATNKTITWTSTDTNVATVNEKGEVTGVAEGTATITATSANGKTATCSVTVAEVGMTIAEAKAAVTSYEALQQYIGTKITDYNPTAGGTWRIFYYDEAGDFGTAGKLYLKRDFVRNDTKLSSYKSYTPSTQGLEIMKAMNPKWRDSSYSSIDLANEHCVAWLCDPANWTDYKTAEADYAIGSPSVEMYMKAFNVWKTGNKDATNLICKVESENGYSVGANGTYANSGYWTNNNTIEAGPNNIFMTAENNIWWLASPSSNDSDCVLNVGDYHASVNGYYDCSSNFGVCPVVSL